MTLQASLDELRKYQKTVNDLYLELIEAEKLGKQIGVGRDAFGKTSKSGEMFGAWQTAADARYVEIVELRSTLRYIVNALGSLRDAYDDADRASANEFRNIPE